MLGFVKLLLQLFPVFLIFEAQFSFSRNKKLVKLLQWEDGGFVIWMKRLEQGGFHIPQSADGRIELTSRELAAILSGIKPQRYYKRYSKKS